MNRPRTPQEYLAHIIRLHVRGVICPSEMWNAIASELTPENALVRLDALPPESQHDLRRIYVELPPYAYIERDSSEPAPQRSDVCVKVVQWCEQDEETRRQATVEPGPPGRVRVCVVDGRVRQRLP
jgi:hypothetical protein